MTSDFSPLFNNKGYVVLAHKARCIPLYFSCYGVDIECRGSIKILVKGEKRIELLQVEQNIPYLIYRVRTLPDTRETGPLAFESPQIERLKDLLNNWVDDTIQDSLERESFYQTLESIHHIIDYLSMFMVGDRHVRQLLLENRSLHERIQMLSSLLRGEYPDCEDNLVVSAMKDFESNELDHYYVH